MPLTSVTDQTEFSKAYEALKASLTHGPSSAHLFEIKTETSTTNLYQAVGQLMLYGALENDWPVFCHLESIVG